MMEVKPRVMRDSKHRGQFVTPSYQLWKLSLWAGRIADVRVLQWGDSVEFTNVVGCWLVAMGCCWRRWNVSKSTVHRTAYM